MDNATKHKLKQQDAFLATTETGLEWAKQNQSTAIFAAVAGLVVVIVLVGGFVFYQHRTTEAQTAFGAAMQTYQTPVANPAQPTPPGTKTFPDDKARAAAANADFLAVADQYGMTKPGKLARYFAGLTYLEEGQNGSAEETLKKVASSWNGDLAALAKESLAELYQQTGRNQDAVPLYEELAKGKATTVPAGLAKIELAELYASEGKTADAKKLYAEVKDQDKDPKGQPGPAAEVASQKLNEKK